MSVGIFLFTMSVMLKVKEAEKKTEKDRALVKEGCGHIRSEDIIINAKTKTKTTACSKRAVAILGLKTLIKKADCFIKKSSFK